MISLTHVCNFPLFDDCQDLFQIRNRIKLPYNTNYKILYIKFTLSLFISNVLHIIDN